MLFTIPYFIFIPSLIIACGIAVIILCFIYAHSFEMIRYDINKNEVIKNNNLNDKYDNKIVFFSDIHLGIHMKEKEFKKIIDKLISLDASLYIFGGDLIGDLFKRYYSIEKVKELFNPLTSKYNCIAINGNHDYRNKFDLNKVGFNTLINKEYIYNNIHIYGMNEGLYNDIVIPNIDNLNKNLILIHEGDFFDLIDGNYTMISGHSHGGQIRIPLLDLCYRPKKGRKYLKGLFKKSNKNLIVSKGLGCNLFKIRFFAKCDIIILDYKN